MLLLSATILVGCFGDDSDDAIAPEAGHSDKRPPALPPGLEMPSAERVAYTKNTITWRWEGTLGAGQWAVQEAAHNAARTTFDVPAAIPFAVKANVTDYDDGPSQLGVTIRNATGTALCASVEGGFVANPPVGCITPSPPLASTRPWSVTVDSTATTVETPFTLSLTLTSGPEDTSRVRAQAAPIGSIDTAHAVIGFADSGINPYHEAFRDHSPEGSVHPATYLEGYPTDAQALELTLDAETYIEALAADAEVWASVRPGALYWIPGTRIVGAIMPQDFVLDLQPEYFCQPVLDCFGHGTAVASRAAAEPYSLCPTCKIVAVQGFTPGFEWIASQEWIDVSSNSWIEGYDMDENVGQRAEDDARIARKPTFFVSGNGLGGHLGVLGQPSSMWSHVGAPNAIAVGGHDNGRVTAWTGSLPHVVADACPHVATHGSTGGFVFGCGTSYAAPYVAGAAGQIVLDARRILTDTSSGVRNGTDLARGTPLDAGPLADGGLDQDELKQILLTTADPRPSATEDDGAACEPGEHGGLCVVGATQPIAWRSIPEGFPQYYFIGYGGVNEDTLENATAVLYGEMPMPERPMEDAFFALDQEVRKALVEVDP